MVFQEARKIWKKMIDPKNKKVLMSDDGKRERERGWGHVETLVWQSPGLLDSAAPEREE